MYYQKIRFHIWETIKLRKEMHSNSPLFTAAQQTEY